MYQTEIKSGTRSVVITANDPFKGPFHSRLYLNRGKTAGFQTAKHKTLKGAKSWAKKILKGREENPGKNPSLTLHIPPRLAGKIKIRTNGKGIKVQRRRVKK